ncbi:MAG: hypothetical protein LBE74_01435 [Treponema sp.]|jgi:hypothetical protein|nr:hypothetical protein [Treponema sp.]
MRILTILAIIAITGCQGELTPEDIKPENNNQGGVGGGEDPRGGKILDQGLAFYNMPGGIFDLEEGTYDTPETIGRTLDPSDSKVGELSPSEEPYVADANEETRAKYIVRGPSSVSTSKLDSGGFMDAAFLYYALPLEGEFTLRARVRMTAKAGDSTSKGYFFGAFTGTPEDVGVKFTSTSQGAGLLFRTNDTADNNSGGGPSIRPYFKNEGGGWSTGPTQSAVTTSLKEETWMNLRQPSWRQERILEIIRESEPRKGGDGKDYITAFVMRVYDSKSGVLRGTVYIYSDAVHESLIVGNNVYVGIALLGSSVEFSEISLWENNNKSGDPIFKTPATYPAYVDVESVKIGVSRDGGSLNTGYGNSSLFANCGIYKVSSVADAKSRPVSLTAVISPDYANNLFVKWEIIKEYDTSGGAITVTPTDGDEESGWRKANVTIEGAGSVVIMATSRDPSLADHCLELVVGE